MSDALFVCVRVCMYEHVCAELQVCVCVRACGCMCSCAQPGGCLNVHRPVPVPVPVGACSKVHDKGSTHSCHEEGGDHDDYLTEQIEI